MQHVDPVRVHVRVLARLLAEPRPRLGVVPGDIFSPLTTADRLPRLVDLAPTDRILLASDGFQELELYWFAAVALRTRGRRCGRPRPRQGLERAG